MHLQSCTDHLGSYSAAIQTALATHLPMGTPVPSMCLHLDNTGTWTASVPCTKLGAPCHPERLHSVVPLTSTHWMSVTSPSCHSHQCLQPMQMSTAGQKSPLGEALILRSWRRKAKCPVLPRDSGDTWSLCTNSLGSGSHSQGLHMSNCMLLPCSPGVSETARGKQPLVLKSRL